MMLRAIRARGWRGLLAVPALWLLSRQLRRFAREFAAIMAEFQAAPCRHPRPGPLRRSRKRRRDARPCPAGEPRAAVAAGARLSVGPNQDRRVFARPAGAGEVRPRAQRAANGRAGSAFEPPGCVAAAVFEKIGWVRGAFVRRIRYDIGMKRGYPAPTGRRARSAVASVPSSRTSSAPPIGTPCASRAHRDGKRFQFFRELVRGGRRHRRWRRGQDDFGWRAACTRASSGARRDLRARCRPMPTACRPARGSGRDSSWRAPAPTDRRRPRPRRSVPGRVRIARRWCRDRGCPGCRTPAARTARAASRHCVRQREHPRLPAAATVSATTRRALRGPRPGSLARSWISRSISGPPMGSEVMERYASSNSKRQLNPGGRFMPPVAFCIS